MFGGEKELFSIPKGVAYTTLPADGNTMAQSPLIVTTYRLLFPEPIQFSLPIASIMRVERPRGEDTCMFVYTLSCCLLRVQFEEQALKEGLKVYAHLSKSGLLSSKGLSNAFAFTYVDDLKRARGRNDGWNLVELGQFYKELKLRHLKVIDIEQSKLKLSNAMPLMVVPEEVDPSQLKKWGKGTNVEQDRLPILIGQVRKTLFWMMGSVTKGKGSTYAEKVFQHAILGTIYSNAFRQVTVVRMQPGEAKPSGKVEESHENIDVCRIPNISVGRMEKAWKGVMDGLCGISEQSFHTYFQPTLSPLDGKVFYPEEGAGKAAHEWSSLVEQILLISVKLSAGCGGKATAIFFMLQDRPDYSLLLSTLCHILCEPQYRTVRGFCALIERHFFLFYSLPLSKSVSIYQSAPLVLLLQCVWCLYSYCPPAFAFQESLLELLFDALLDGKFGTFLNLSGSSIKDKNTVKVRTVSVWTQVMAKVSDFMNPLYLGDPKVQIDLGKKLLDLSSVLYPRIWPYAFFHYVCYGKLLGAMSGGHDKRVEEKRGGGFGKQRKAGATHQLDKLIHSGSVADLRLPDLSLFTIPPDLTRFDISGNLLSVVPSTLSIAKNITVLSLRSNSITYLGPLVGSLPHLRKFDVSENMITSLDSNLSSWAPGVRAINFAQNGFQRFPVAAIRGCKQLKHIDLSDCKYLTALPEPIEDIPSVVSLILSHIPNVFVGMQGEWSLGTSLLRIDLSKNELTHLPLKRDSLASLLMMDMSHNAFEGAFPGCLQAASRLIQFDISFNPLLRATEMDFLGVQYLRKLNMSHCDLGEIPPSLCETCVVLEELDVSYNGIAKLSPIIQSFANSLKKLNVRGNKLQTLPSALGLFHKLGLLDVRENRLRKLPATMGFMKTLRALSEAQVESKVGEEEEGLLLDGEDMTVPDASIVRRGTAAILAHLRLMFGGYTKNKSVKVMILGQENVGKTTLVSSIMGLSKRFAEVSDGDSNGDKKKKKKKKAKDKKTSTRNANLTVPGRSMGDMSARSRNLGNIARRPSNLETISVLDRTNSSFRVDSVTDLSYADDSTTSDCMTTNPTVTDATFPVISSANLYSLEALMNEETYYGKNPVDNPVEKPSLSTDGIDVVEWKFAPAYIGDYGHSVDSPIASEEIAALVGQIGVQEAEGREEGSDSEEGGETDGDSFEDQLGRELTFNLWDFAGQKLYYATHQFFLDRSAFCILVWNVADVSTLKRVIYWVEAIQALDAIPILLVGTHLDDEVCTPSYLSAREAEVSALIANHPGMNITPVMVSCKTSKGMLGLMLLMHTIAYRSPFVRMMIPKSFIGMEKDLKQLSMVTIPPVISLQELRSIAESCGISDEREQESAALSLHRIGTILYFDRDPSLKDLVVLNPVWLSGLISTVVTTKHRFGGAGGILTLSDLRNLWNSPEYPEHLHEQLRSLLERFEVIMRISIDADTENVHQIKEIPMRQKMRKGRNMEGSAVMIGKGGTHIRRRPRMFNIAVNEVGSGVVMVGIEEYAAMKISEKRKKNLRGKESVGIPLLGAHKAAEEAVEGTRKEKEKMDVFIVPSLVSRSTCSYTPVWPMHPPRGVHEWVRSYEFTFFPAGIIFRLIVRLAGHAHIATYWKSGFVLGKAVGAALKIEIIPKDITTTLTLCGRSDAVSTIAVSLWASTIAVVERVIWEWYKLTPVLDLRPEVVARGYIDLGETLAEEKVRGHCKAIRDFIVRHKALGAKCLLDTLSRDTKPEVAMMIVGAFAHTKDLSRVVKYIAEHDVETQRKETLFRGESSLVLLMRALGSQVLFPWVKRIIHIIVVDLINVYEDTPLLIELDRRKDERLTDTALEENVAKLTSLVHGAMSVVFSVFETIPAHILASWKQVVSIVSSKFDEKTSSRALGNFLFLRLLVPSLLGASKVLGMDNFSAEILRTLVLLAKVLQNITTGALFQTKQAFLSPMNSLVEKHGHDYMMKLHRSVCKRKAESEGEDELRISDPYVRLQYAYLAAKVLEPNEWKLAVRWQDSHPEATAPYVVSEERFAVFEGAVHQLGEWRACPQGEALEALWQAVDGDKPLRKEDIAPLTASKIGDAFSRKGALVELELLGDLHPLTVRFPLRIVAPDMVLDSLAQQFESSEKVAQAILTMHSDITVIRPFAKLFHHPLGSLQEYIGYVRLDALVRAPNADGFALSDLARYARILTSLNCVHLPKLLNIVPQPPYSIRWVRAGPSAAVPLSTCLQEGIVEGMPWAYRLKVAIDITKALIYLQAQSPPLLIRNLTPQSVLVPQERAYDGEVYAVVTGLADAAPSSEAAALGRGEVMYWAPELDALHYCSEQSEVFMLGGILHALSGESSIHLSLEAACTWAEQMSVHADYERALGQGLRERMPEYAALIALCMHVDIHRRPSLIEIADSLRGIMRLYCTQNDVEYDVNVCTLGLKPIATLNASLDKLQLFTRFS